MVCAEWVVTFSTFVWSAWELERYAYDVQGMSWYAWAKAVWQYLVDTMEDMQRKLSNPVSQMQFNGLYMLLQVRVVNTKFLHRATTLSVCNGGNLKC